MPLAPMLKECGIQAGGARGGVPRRGPEKEKKWQAGNREFVAPHGRSVYVQDALNPEAMLAFH